MGNPEVKDSSSDSEILKPRPEAVILDMDGVIVDSESLQSRSFEAVLIEYGKSPVYSDQGIVQTVGINARDNWLSLMERYGIQEDIDLLIKKKRVVYAALLRDSVVPMPGFLRFLDDLKDKPVRKAIASSSARQHIDLVVAKLGVQEHFSVLVSGEDVKQGKPSPDVFLVAASQLQVPNTNCVVLEDAPNGVEAAKRAGMKVIVVPNRFTAHHDFTKADKVVPSLEQLNWEAISSLYN